MSLPSAAPAAPPTVTINCPCGQKTVTFPEGERVPECDCGWHQKPPSEREVINVYELVDGHPKAFTFFAQALPLGERPVNVFGDSADAVVKNVKRLLDAGWKQ